MTSHLAAGDISGQSRPIVPPLLGDGAALTATSNLGVGARNDDGGDDIAVLIRVIVGDGVAGDGVVDVCVCGCF